MTTTSNSFYNIYCKENLKRADLHELEFWHNEFDSLINNTLDHYKMVNDYGKLTIEKIMVEIAEDFAEFLKERMGYMMQDVIVGIIDNYEDDEIKEVENPTNFFYKKEDDE